MVGAAVLEKWNFSRVLVMTTLHHDDLQVAHEDEEDGDSLYRLTAIVNLSDCICRRLGIGQREADESVDVAGCLGAVALGLDEEQIQQALEDVELVFSENRESFTG